MAEILPGENRYSIKKNDNEEWHIFPATKTDSGCTLLTNKSVCQAMNSNQKTGTDYRCLTDQITREKCAKLGRSVCGVCVSHLYKTLTTEELKRINS